MSRFYRLKDLRITNAVAGVLFVFSTATISHLLFSHLGFNPTDDGWLLAGSRRIIEGQIPHYDFISHMPTFSFFLHAPFVLFGGNYVFLISRYFVWLQLASIAWLWTVMITRSFKVFNTLAEKFIVAVISFVFSVHHFPIMAWFTIDGFFFISFGILLCHNESRWTKMVGYTLVGIAPLCKQSFLPMIPIILLVFDDWRQLVPWIMASIPIAAYGVFLAIFGALPDAIIQLTAYSNFLSLGVTPYVTRLSVPLGIVTGGLAIYMTRDKYNFQDRSVKTALLRLFGISILFVIVFAAAWSLARGGYRYDIYPDIFGYYLPFQISPSFGIFGVAVGAILYFILREQKTTSYLRVGMLAVFIAWCTSLSFGYRVPTLGTGPLILFLVASVKFSFQLKVNDSFLNTTKSAFERWISSSKNLQTVVNILVILSVASSLVAFGIARETNIYREQPASNLTYDLGCEGKEERILHHSRYRRKLGKRFTD
jgi:hypothetical protein